MVEIHASCMVSSARMNLKGTEGKQRYATARFCEGGSGGIGQRQKSAGPVGSGAGGSCAGSALSPSAHTAGRGGAAGSGSGALDARTAGSEATLAAGGGA